MTVQRTHTVKFYKLDANGIICMAYEEERKKLALSRSDSTVEIWDLSNVPHIEKTIPSRCNSSIEALSWYHDRLFSVGLQGVLTEYNLYSLCEKYTKQFTGGIGWCMDIHKSTKNLVIGTEQGYLNLGKIQEDEVSFKSLFQKQDGKVFCLKFDQHGDYIASGSVNTIRVWNVKTGQVIHRINISRESHKAEIFVYCLTITNDFTIISGDSRGFLTFWDGKLGAQIESHQSHSASILAVCLSQNQKTVYCTGQEPLIVSYEKIKVKGDSLKWVRSTQRKFNEYEVRCLFEVKEKLYCGGVDGYISCSYPPKYLVKYPPLLQNPSVCLSRDAKYILLRYPKNLELWSLGEVDATEGHSNFPKLKKQPVKLLDLQTKQDDSTLCANISNNGNCLVYSTIGETRVFSFIYESEKPEIKLIQKIPVSSVKIEFTPDSRQLILAPSKGDLVTFHIVENKLIALQNIKTSDVIKDTITLLQVSEDRQYLVAADSNSNIAVWISASEKWQFHCKLPVYEYSPTAMAIQPVLNSLIIVYSDHKVVEFNLKDKALTSFSIRQSSNSSRLHFGKSFPITNISFAANAENIILLHDDSNIYVIDKERRSSSPLTKMMKLDYPDKQDRINYVINTIKREKHLVYFGYLNNNEMVCVEVQPSCLLRNVRPSIIKKKYGFK